MDAQDAYERLVVLLDAENARYRLIDHAAEGRTELVSGMRGHAPKEAAKCIILMLKTGKKITHFILAVVPGDSRVDLEAVKRQKGATLVRFADPGVAESLAGCVSGAVLPFAFDPKLELIVDPDVAASKIMYFNAGRLDRSIALDTEDYLRIAKPRIARIALSPA